MSSSSSSSSSIIRGSSRAIDEASGIVRRMVSLPRSILGNFSRAMGISSRRNPNPQLPILPPIFPQNPPNNTIQEEWAFLACFEQHYGTVHPFFYALRFVEVLKVARDESKFVFVYLHAPEHPFTAEFCKGSLCSEAVVEFLDVNFVSWGGLASSGEGFNLARVLQPGSFPFCAVVAPASGDNMAVLQQIEGPVSPAELLEILQRTMEEQGSAFGNTRVNDQEQNRRRADRQMREEQDAAYLASLHIDKDKDRLKNSPREQRVQKPAESSTKVNSDQKLKQKQNPTGKQSGKAKEANNSGETQPKNIVNAGKDQVTQILLRFPNGERREQNFMCTDKIQSIYRYVDSLGLPGVGNYKLISNFPRKVYGVDQMGMTLKDAGLHPRASLFLELM